VVNTTFVVRPVRQTSHVRMRGKMTAKDTSSLKLTRNLVLYKNLTDLSSFLTKSSTEIDNQRAVTQAEVLMCELIAKYIIYISKSLYGNFHEILDY
jgi:hypothetical protein